MDVEKERQTYAMWSDRAYIESEVIRAICRFAMRSAGVNPNSLLGFLGDIGTFWSGPEPDWSNRVPRKLSAPESYEVAYQAQRRASRKNA